ncbi:MAG: short-chain dehydrogenase, partial [Flavobacteriaceae bacterium]|nr:short-chain dehydrogenase [Flavobacteriaceae bacterium]
MKISLKNKKAFVGGSSKGLGYAVAKQLAICGAEVTLVSRNESLLKKNIIELKELTGRNHNFLLVDYNNSKDYKKIIDDFFKINTIDILINNTQGPPAGDVLSVGELDYEKSFNLLFQNTVNTSMAAMKGMKKNSWGRIINMTSVSVKEPLSYLALSNTIRSAVTSWGKTLSIESGKYNITVNNILTGFFNTERLNQLNEEKAKKFNVKTSEVFEKMSEMVPLKRIGEPEEFGYLIAFLSSEYSSYINGVNIPIDGGLLKSM